MQSNDPLRERDWRKRREYFNDYHRKRFKEKNWPKCEDCGYIARRFADVGCLNCYAMEQPRRPFTGQEIDLIEIHAGKDDPKNLQFRLYSETGIARTRETLRQKIKYMGIRTLDHQDAYTIAQLMEITGRPRNTFISLIREGRVKNIGKGSRILISTDEGDRLIEWYRKKETPSYSVAEVMKILGYSEDAVRRAYRERGLPCWNEGHDKRICKATVDRAAAYLRETGKVRIHWRLLVKR